MDAGESSRPISSPNTNASGGNNSPAGSCRRACKTASSTPLIGTRRSFFVGDEIGGRPGGGLAVQELR
jgi:hypothetical protein